MLWNETRFFFAGVLMLLLFGDTLSIISARRALASILPPFVICFLEEEKKLCILYRQIYLIQFDSIFLLSWKDLKIYFYVPYAFCFSSILIFPKNTSKQII